jgi:serine/threonine protein kinase
LAYDTEEGIEVAWNELRLDHLRKSQVSKVLSEVQILSEVRHESIINLYHTWISQGSNTKVKFITELMSTNLKSYVKKAKGQIKPKVIKNWCRQILRGLHHLHSRTPPIVHRDLKSDNIFINANTGTVRIGDLGLATTKQGQFVSSVLGTPEFMAPELYDEKYDEKVDIYAFGMCVLEMCTKEYPYAECTNQAQIYRKVTSKVKPLALGKIKDLEMRRFIELCIEFNPEKRPHAEELLNHSFLSESNTDDTYSLSDNSGKQDFGDYAPYDPRSLPASALCSPHTSTTFEYAPQLSLVKQESFVQKSQDILKENKRLSSVDSGKGLSIYSNNFEDGSCALTVEAVQFTNPTITIRLVCFKGKNGTSSSSKQEIKFPFHLDNDSAESVVTEMINENVLDESYRDSAISKISALVKSYLSPHSHSEPSLLMGGDKDMNFIGIRARSRSMNTMSNLRDRMNLSSPASPMSTIHAVSRRSSSASSPHSTPIDALATQLRNKLNTVKLSPTSTSQTQGKAMERNDFMQELHRKQKFEAEQLARKHAEEWLATLNEQHENEENSAAQAQNNVNISRDAQFQAESHIAASMDSTKSIPGFESPSASLILPENFWSWGHDDQLEFLSSFLREQSMSRSPASQGFDHYVPLNSSMNPTGNSLLSNGTNQQNRRRTHSRTTSAPVNTPAILIPHNVVSATGSMESPLGQVNHILLPVQYLQNQNGGIVLASTPNTPLELTHGNNASSVSLVSLPNSIIISPAGATTPETLDNQAISSTEKLSDEK